VPFGIFYGHLVNFVVFLVYFYPFWYIVLWKIWQPCAERHRPQKCEKKVFVFNRNDVHVHGVTSNNVHTWHTSCFKEEKTCQHDHFPVGTLYNKEKVACQKKRKEKITFSLKMKFSFCHKSAFVFRKQKKENCSLLNTVVAVWLVNHMVECLLEMRKTRKLTKTIHSFSQTYVCKPTSPARHVQVAI
jgi:hypothetical protein